MQDQTFGTYRESGSGEGRDDGKAADAPRLLVVDDDTIHRMIILKVATKAGYVADQAATVQSASAQILANSYDCVLLDLKLGSQSGIELLTQMHEQRCQTPIIIISAAGQGARTEVMRLARLYALNISELPKPVDLAVLRARLARLKPGASLDD
jgi:DNA-binding response OmpR family regulator